ncbi:MAG: hypothetical protein DDT21_01947 [Syntrophomonadaceae bacterium]|nr:hypothetical protein [Bacillota bacterium]
MQKKLLAGMSVLILLAALVGGATMALFTDSVTNAGNAFTAGTVDIEVGDDPTVPVHVYNMAPGDTYNGSFTVRNAGTLELRYSVSAATAGPLFAVQGVAPGNTPAVVALTANHTNVVLAPGGLATVAFTVYLPLTAGNDYQGDVGTVNFTINAVQTANNPLNALVNGGFEAGNFTGWNVNFPELAQVVTTYQADGGGGPIYTASEGGHFAVLHAGAEDVYTEVSQAVVLSAGQTLAGRAAFDAVDYLPFNDDAAVVIISGGPLATPWAKSVAVVGNYGQSAWESWSWTAPVAGVYTLSLRVRNVNDDSLPSVALFDANVIQ